jgi:hypothetical protein
MGLDTGPLGQPRTPDYAGRAEARQPFVSLLIVRCCEGRSPFPWDKLPPLGLILRNPQYFPLPALPPTDARGGMLSDRGPCLAWQIPAFGAASSPVLEERLIATY